jgi:gamma-glutamylcyclotransferase (GGCT)/AIG2-like uncharacterized protein YtfP
MARVFVYGTLKKGFPAHKLMVDADAKFEGIAVTDCAYQLYDQGNFPGMVEEDGPTGVHGEVYDVPEKAMSKLDAYECVSSGLFRRAEIELADGTKALAYLFARDYYAALRIESGVWDERGSPFR